MSGAGHLSLVKGERFGKRHLAGLRRLMQRWRHLAAKQIWDDDLRDCSWWYGERASVSQLAGAAWTLDGWAIQDYAWQRRKRYAQVDLCVEHHGLKLRFIAEAKQIWPCLTKPDSLADEVENAFERLKDELGEVEPDGWSQLMFVFVTPWTSTTKGPSYRPSDAKIEAFVSALAELDEAAVWTFPSWARDRKIDFRRGSGMTFYPGVALLAREL